MAQRKEFKTDLVFNGRVDSSLPNSVKNIQGLLNGFKKTSMGIGALYLFNKAKDATIEFGKGLLGAASDLQETQGKVNEIFKSGSTGLEKWSDTATKTMGLSKQSALDAAGLYGDMATGMSISREKAAQMAMTLTQLGADLSSFKNISTDIAQTALKGVFTGETESLKNLGVVMTQANLQEFAYSRGIKKKIEKMKEAEKVELRYQYVLSKTKNAQGDYARTSQNAANAQRTFQQAVVDLQAKIGENFLPYYATLLNNINAWLVANSDEIIKFSVNAAKGLAEAIKTLGDIYNSIVDIINFVSSIAQPALITLSGIIGGLVTFKTIQAFQMLQVQMALATKEAGILGIVANGNLVGALKAMTSATWSSVRALAAQTAALLANPITWIVLGVAALTAGLVALALNWDKVTNAVTKATQAVRNFLHLNGNAEAPKVQVNQSNQPQKHNALGTNSFVGGSTWVGEHGPEYVSIPRGASISSNNRSMGAMGNVSMPITININGNADAKTMKNAVSDIMPNIKAQIDAYFREKQRRGVSFA